MLLTFTKKKELAEQLKLTEVWMDLQFIRTSKFILSYLWTCQFFSKLKIALFLLSDVSLFRFHCNWNSKVFLDSGIVSLFLQRKTLAKESRLTKVYLYIQICSLERLLVSKWKYFDCSEIWCEICIGVMACFYFTNWKGIVQDIYICQ